MRKHTLAAGCWPLGRACLSRCLSRCLAPAVGFYGGLGARCQYKVGGVAAYSRGLCTSLHTAGAARTWHVHVASACCVHAVLTDRHGTHVPCAPGPATGSRGAELLCARVLYGPLCVLHTKAAPLKLSFFCRLYRVSVVFRESVWRVSVTVPPPKHGLCERPCVLIISVVLRVREVCSLPWRGLCRASASWRMPYFLDV